MVKRIAWLFGCISLSVLSWAQNVSIAGQWKFRMEDNPAFSRPDFDDKSWSSVTVPSGWNKLGILKERSIGWYRTMIQVPDNMLGKDLILIAGTIDDADICYFNGEMIGSTGRFPPGDESAWDTERKYFIPAKGVKKNSLLAIRVYNGIGDGGLYGGRVMLTTKASYDKQVAEQIRSKKSYYQLTTSNGLISAVYNEQTEKVENFFPHIFSYYDSGLVVQAVAREIGATGGEKPLSVKYLGNTHVIDVAYPSYHLYYFASFTRENKILYAVARGVAAKVKALSFQYTPGEGSITMKESTRTQGATATRYVLFGFADTLHALPDMDKALANLPSVEEEVGFMKAVFARCHYPKGLTPDEKNVFEQGLSILKMSQVGDKEIFPLSHGQVMASLRPGVWAICWVRDGAFAIEAMSKVGMYEEARKALEFQLQAKPTDQFIHYVHTDGVDYGLGVPYIISMTRYFGNGREECDYTTDGGPNIELDGLGLFLTATYHYVQQSGDIGFVKTHREELSTIARAIIHNTTEKGILRRDSGPWEHHLPGKEFMWSTGTCASGLQQLALLQNKAGYDSAEVSQAARRLVDGIMKNALIEGRYIKGNATEQSPGDHHYFDAATFELYAGGLIPDRKLFLSHMAEYNKHNRAVGDPNRGYIRFNSNDSYENQEWPFAGLRVAVAQVKLGSRVEAKKLIDRVTAYASRNHNQVPEILSNDMGIFKGAIPMVGYGSGAYILALVAYY